MSRRLLTITIAAFVSACASYGSPEPAAAPVPVVGVEQAAATITPEDMYRRTAYLASDEMGGRDTPSPGLELAATWIADEFRAFGLSPAGDRGTFIQRYPWTQTSMDPDRTAVHFEIAGNSTTAVFAQDFFLIPGGSEATSGGLVWGGTAMEGMAPLGPEASGGVVSIFLPVGGTMPKENLHTGM